MGPHRALVTSGMASHVGTLFICVSFFLSLLSPTSSLPSPIPSSSEDFHLSSGLKVSVTDYSLFDYGLSHSTQVDMMVTF